MQDYRKLVVWQKSHEIVLEMYRLTKRLPSEERFGMVSQMRRAAVSVAANIVEGCGRGSDPDFARFLQQALGSALEIDYFCLLAKDLGYVAQEQIDLICSRIVEVRRMLLKLIETVRNRKGS